MLKKLLIGSAVGLVSHQSNRIVVMWEDGGTGPAWTRLARYTIGMLSCLPVGMMFFRHLYRRDMEQEEAVSVFAVSYVTAGVSFGVGVALGYILDRLIDRIAEEL